MNQRRYRAVMGLLLLLVIGAFLASVGQGAVSIAPAQVVAVFLSKAGVASNTEVSPLHENVLWSIRLPRALLGLIVGGALAVSGVVLQGVFRNPLAEPSLLGISGGAVVGAMIATVLRVQAGLSAIGQWTVPVAGFAGALIVSLALYSSFRRAPRRDVTTFVLTGVIINVILGAIITLLPNVFRDGGLGSNTTFWTLGGLGGTMWPMVHLAAPISLGAAALLWPTAAKLNLMALGDTDAEYLGVDTHAVRLQSLVLISLVTGAAVAFAGVIAFVGLVVPHALRLVIGPDHRRLLPASALGGALMVCIADTFARTIVAPTELPVGVLTTVVGGPLFFILLRQARAQGRWT